jgi:hypothetical protein
MSEHNMKTEEEFWKTFDALITMGLLWRAGKLEDSAALNAVHEFSESFSLVDTRGWGNGIIPRQLGKLLRSAPLQGEKLPDDKWLGAYIEPE